MVAYLEMENIIPLLNFHISFGIYYFHRSLTLILVLVRFSSLFCTFFFLHQVLLFCNGFQACAWKKTEKKRPRFGKFMWKTYKGQHITVYTRKYVERLSASRFRYVHFWYLCTKYSEKKIPMA